MMNWITSHEPLLIALAYLLLPVFGKAIEGKLPTLGKLLQSIGLDHYKVAAALVKKQTGVDAVAALDAIDVRAKGIDPEETK